MTKTAKTLGLVAAVALIATLAAADSKGPALLLGQPKGESVYQRDLSPELDVVTVSVGGAANMKGVICGLDVGGPADGSIAEYVEACAE